MRLTDKELRGLAENTRIYCHAQGDVYMLTAEGAPDKNKNRDFRGYHNGSTDWFLAHNIPTDRFLTPGGAVDAAMLWLKRQGDLLDAKRKAWGV